MLESLGLLGLLTTLALVLGRALHLAIVLRGTRPAERAEIICALNACVPRPAASRRRLLADTRPPGESG